MELGSADVHVIAWAMAENVHPELQETVVDRTHSTLRSITSLVDVAQPGLGSLFGELIQVVLPANREERMAKFVTALDRRLRAIDVQLAEIFRTLDAEQLALLEDGLRASARATQERRIEQIAGLVAEGVAKPDEAARRRSVLDLLVTLTDHDVAYLARFANWRGSDEGRRFITTGQLEAMSESERREFDLARQSETLSRHRLIAAGLLRALLSVKRSSDGDGEGTVAPGDPRLTEFGEHFVMELGLWTSGDRRLFPRH